MTTVCDGVRTKQLGIFEMFMCEELKIIKESQRSILGQWQCVGGEMRIVVRDERLG